VCNVYAPNGYDNEKHIFFHTIFQDLEQWDGSIVLGGDLNITLGPQDRHCRGATAAEILIADTIKTYVADQNLTDCWQGTKGYTWRRGKVMSKLDRIYFRTPHYEQCKLKVRWTLTTSDHAGLILTLKHTNNVRQRNEHVKLDNDVVLNPQTLVELSTYVEEQVASATWMNPHMKLEFTKMSIRTKAANHLHGPTQQ